MPKNIALLISLLFLSFTGYSRNLFYFGFFSTSDSINTNITRTGSKNDLELVSSHTKQIADNLHLNLISRVFYDESFKIENANAVLRGTSFSNDDIVLIYYATHGFRTHNQVSLFPRALISNNEKANLYTNNIHFENFCDSVYKKSPGLLIGVIDACNISDEVLNAEMQESPLLFPREISKDVAVERYTELFLKLKGELLISSTSKEEYANVEASGSTFTSNLFKSLDSYSLKNRRITWETILENAKIGTRIYLKIKNNDSKQTPFWKANLTYDNVAVKLDTSSYSPIHYDEFETVINTGKNQYNKREYENALISFNKAHELKRDNPYAVFYANLCEGILDYKRFSSNTMSNMCKFLSDPDFEKYIQQKDFASIQYLIAITYLKGGSNCGKNTKEAMRWLYISANNGFEPANERIEDYK